MSQLIEWFQDNYIESLGAISGLLYLYFSIKQKIWLWPLGILTSGFYIFVFFNSNLYADMGLNVYYVIISIYGWYYWLFGKNSKNSEFLKTSKLDAIGWLITVISIILIWVLLAIVLIKLPQHINIPPSDLLYWDSFTTSASIVATYLLARKKIEQWLLWIIIDAVSAGLYIYKELYPTVLLFLVYTILAFVGYLQWKKDLD